jgi:hypothetical protein
MTTAPLSPGDPAPNFFGICAGNPRFRFDSVAGRYVLIAFLGSLAQPAAQATMQAIRARLSLFDDEHAACFIVTIDADDFSQGRAADRLPGLRHFDDRDAAISRLYGSAQDQGGGCCTCWRLPIRRRSQGCWIGWSPFPRRPSMPACRCGRRCC